MRADLHVHSTASDGTLTPAELVTRAHANGVGVLALTDHDSVDGLAEATLAAEQTGLALVYGVELSSVHEDADVHLLGYFVDPSNDELADMLAELRAARLTRARAMVAALAQAGYGISLDGVLAISGGGAVGRSHIARALVAGGHAGTVSEAFERLIGRGRPFYVPKASASPVHVITRLRALGAVPVLAHPGVTQVDALIPELVSAGLLGIEAYHADHTAEQRAEYAALAQELGLVATGGSDFHGPDSPNPDVGSVQLPEEALEAFLGSAPSL